MFGAGESLSDEHLQGKILIDTGWDNAIRQDARANEGFFNYFASSGLLPDGEGIIDQLALYGFSTDDLDYCPLAHLDIDHARGIDELRNAGHVMCSRAGWNADHNSDAWTFRWHDSLPDRQAGSLCADCRRCRLRAGFF